MVRNSILRWLSVSLGLALLVSACGSATNSSAASFKGQTIDLISSGGAGSTHDLAARAVAPYLAQYLHATVDVVDKPGGGQLLAWNYVSQTKPDGLTIGTLDVQGIMANVWEKVPGQQYGNPANLTMLGGFAGGIGGGAKVMFSSATSGPASSIYSLVADHSQKVTELGSVGDVSGPLLFKVYGVPYVDLTSYADSTAELQGILRGDGQISVKTWGGGWASFVTSGKGKVLLEYSMRPHWGVDASVPTLATLFKRDPLSAQKEAALKADASGLDAGMAIFGPRGIPAAKTALLRKAMAWATKQPGFIAAAKKAQISQYYESWQAEVAALKAGLKSSTISEMRKYVPLSTGVAS